MNGMVLSAMPIGDYDKRLIILTVERGKISAFARGARKPNSSLLACSQPFSYGEFTVYAGRDSYTVTAAQVSNYFPGLREEPEKVYLGIYFCEVADYFAREGNDERGMLGLLYQSLRALESKKFAPKLVRHIFELKAVCIDGEAPLVFECVCCGLGKRKAATAAGRTRIASATGHSGENGSEEEELSEKLTYFYIQRNGMVCKECAKKLPHKLFRKNFTETARAAETEENLSSEKNLSSENKQLKSETFIEVSSDRSPEQSKEPEITERLESKKPEIIERLEIKESDTISAQSENPERTEGLTVDISTENLKSEITNKVPDRGYLREDSRSFAEENSFGIVPVRKAALYAMQYVVSSPCTQLYRFTLTDHALEEFGMLVGQYIKKHMNHEMKSLQVLKVIGELY